MLEGMCGELEGEMSRYDHMSLFVYMYEIF